VNGNFEESDMGLFGRIRAKRTERSEATTASDHLAEFVRSRDGVEAFLEPTTQISGTTLLLVAATGEWTRRRVPGPDAARSFAKKHKVPLYDAGVVGYPQRMREWDRRQKE
jgi:hypothetical protein